MITIFALIAVTLFVVVGLAVDGGLAYLRSNAAERAASAAALAGVPYMPGGFATTATAAAKSASSRNGFTDGDTTGGRSVGVSVSRYPAGCSGSACADNKLSVTVSENVQTTFLNLIGLGSHRISQTANAQFLPPVGLGQPGAQIGPDTMADVGNAGKQNGAYVPWMEGWGVAREMGDAFTPDPNKTPADASATCEQNTTSSPVSFIRGAANSTDVHAVSKVNSSEVPDSTMTGAGLSALPTRGGYNYLVSVPSGSGAVKVQVYNPAFAPDKNNALVGSMNEGIFFQFDTSTTPTPYDNKLRYSTMEYTIFRVNDQFDHGSDAPIAQVVFNPLNASGANFTDMRTAPTAGSTFPSASASSIYHNWADVIGNATTPSIAGDPASSGGGAGSGATGGVSYKGTFGTPLGAGTYRLRIDALDWNGFRPGPTDDGASASDCSWAGKSYSVRVADTQVPSKPCSQAGSLCPNVSLTALNDMTIFTPTKNTFDMPLFYLPSDYAGLTINVWLYDLGDITVNSGSPAASVAIVDPSKTTATTATAIQDLGRSRGNASEGAVDSCLNSPPQPNAAPAPGPQASATQASLITQYPTQVQNKATCDNQLSTPQGPFIPRGPWNGTWLQFQISVPANYDATLGTYPGYWYLHYNTGFVAGGNQAEDVLSAVVGFNGTAVHLIP